MYTNILSDEQKKIVPLLDTFKNKFFLAGGTAIALQIGHRKSIDFDLFSQEDIGVRAIVNQINREGFVIEQTFVHTIDEYTAIINGVKISFISYPFLVKGECDLEGMIKTPNLLTLASMKAYALGRRAKWKDYVDLYFILKNHFSIDIITDEAKKIFGGSFNSRSFREQLIWFEGIDYSEKIEFMSGFEVDDEQVREYLMGVVK